MVDRHDLCSLADVKRQLGLAESDTRDDWWLYSAIATVSDVIEVETGRWLAPRGELTRYFDGSWTRNDGRTLVIPVGVDHVTYLGVAWADQPDDGSGSYHEVTRGVHIRGRGDVEWPGTRIELDPYSNLVMPSYGYNTVKVTASQWGHAVTPPRVAEIAAIAVVRSYRARGDGSGSPDIAVAGPDGGVRILRRIAPDEMEELRRNWGSRSRTARLSASIA